MRAVPLSCRGDDAGGLSAEMISTIRRHSIGCVPVSEEKSEMSEGPGGQPPGTLPVADLPLDPGARQIPSGGLKLALNRLMLILVSIAVFVALSLSALTLMPPPDNARDNADPSKLKEMIRITQEGGRLAPFPTTATGFDIKAEGGMFTRSFRGHFTDTPEHIEAWLARSPGVKPASCKSVPEGRKCTLQTADGEYGEVLISPDRTTVHFYLSWS